MKNLLPKIMFSVFMMFLFGRMSEVQDSYAVPASPDIHTLTQPDGITFAAYQIGDERGHWVATTDGYIIVQNQQEYWTYAVRNVAGQIVPTTMVVGRDDPVTMGILKQLGPIDAVIPSTGRMPVLLIIFPDTTTVTTVVDFKAVWFGSDTPVNVTGWYTARHPYEYYGVDVPDAQGQRVRDRYAATLVIEAVQAADATVDFGRYDANGDCYVDLVMVIHQGLAQEESRNSSALWSHQGTLNTARTAGDGTGEVTTNDRCNPDNLMKVNAYAIQPEIRSLNR